MNMGILKREKELNRRSTSDRIYEVIRDDIASCRQVFTAISQKP
jgi:hypothetical protein